MELDIDINQVLFSYGNMAFTLKQLLLIVFVWLALFVVHRLLLYPLIKKAFVRFGLDKDRRKSILNGLRNLFILFAIWALLYILSLDIFLYESEEVNIRLSNLFQGLMILQFAKMADWIFSKIILKNYFSRRDERAEKGNEKVHSHSKDPENTATRLIQYIVYVVAIVLIIQNFNLDYTFSEKIGDKDVAFKLSKVFIATLIILSSRLFVWVIIQLILYGYYKRRGVNIGSQYAVNQLLSYVIYMIAALWALNSLGIEMTLIWGGAAALLVGVGLGLQQTFNDLISGIVLLFERTVEVGDVVQLDSLIGRVKRIGLRTSVVETWENIAVVVPNSRMVSDQVINYSHNDLKTRFNVSVGVAYGSDTELVKKLLMRATQDVKFILQFPTPFVRFTDFGNSSLDFEIHFWTHRLVIVEEIKSNLRFEIDKLFRENGVSIPFPQRDLWIRNPESLSSRGTDDKK